jgi:hypothetical protein
MASKSFYIAISILMAALILNISEQTFGDEPVDKNAAKKPSAKQPKEKNNEALKTQSKTTGAKKPELKKLGPKELLIKKMMRAVHRGKNAPLVVLAAETKAKKPNWEHITKSAQFVEIMADMLREKDNKQPGLYVAAAVELTAASKTRDLKKATKALASISTSCTGWAGWAGAPK